MVTSEPQQNFEPGAIKINFIGDKKCDPWKREKVLAHSDVLLFKDSLNESMNERADHDF